MTQPAHIDAEYVEHQSSALTIIEDKPLVSTGVMPIVTPDEARAQMLAYTALVEAVVTSDDYQEFTEKKKVDGRYVETTKRFKKKSAVKKLQTYFGFTLEIVDWRRQDLGDGHFGYEVKAAAVSPNGRRVESLAACSTLEERFDLQRYDDESELRFANRQRKANARAMHDVLSTAETRATNRAAMNLIGAGEVTAEEISRNRQRQAARGNEPKRNDPPATPTFSTNDLIALGERKGYPGKSFGTWLVENVAADLRTRSHKVLRPDEIVVAKDLLDAMPDVSESELMEPPSRPRAPKLPTEKQRSLLFALHSQRGDNDGDRHLIYKRLTGKMSFKDLTADDVARVIDHISPKEG